MDIEISLLSNDVYIEPPQDLIGWVGWLLLLAVYLVALWRRQRDYSKQPSQVATSGKLRWGIFIALLLLLPLTSLFFVFRLPPGNPLPLTGKPVEPQGPAFVVFALLPAMLAAGTISPFQSAFLGAVTGLFLTLYDTHLVFTPVEYAILTLLLHSAFFQRYRTRLYRSLRHPLFTALVLSVLYPILHLLANLLSVSGSLASRLDYALNHVTMPSYAMGGMLLVAGIVVEILANALPKYWGSQSAMIPAPTERKLQTRFLYNMAPLALAIVFILMAGNWFVAYNAARQMLQDKMASTARLAAETIPFFLESGQNLIKQLAEDPHWLSSPAQEQTAIMQKHILTVPFFRQFYLVNANGEVIAGYPESEFHRANSSPEELLGIELALNGVLGQYYTVPPAEGELAAGVSFMTALFDTRDQIKGVLVGRTYLGSNPFTQPMITNLNDLTGEDGEGFILDSDRQVLYHSKAIGLMNLYQGQTPEEALFYDDRAPDGTRRLVYSTPARGHSWTIVLSLPARHAQQLALNIASPLLLMILLLFLLAGLIIRLGLRVVTRSLHTLALEAERISNGELNRSLSPESEDEVGQLRRAFDQMRVSLKARLDELNRLLLVSQGVASSLEIDQSVAPVLESALTTGACAARVVLAPEATPEMEGDHRPNRFGMGTASELYSGLDEQILALTRVQDRVVLSNLSRVRLFSLTPGVPRPEAILAMALRHDNAFHGALWLAFDQPHQFSDDEVRFMTTLAGQTALAATNARLFLNAEAGRQRLASILSSTPDPVLVTDSRDRLLLANPAAWQVLGLGVESSVGKPVESILTQKELVQLLRSSAEDHKTVEITLSDGKVYLASASSIIADGRQIGRVGVLRDVTRFIELETLKSEFVATVSHDLRSPLTYMHGYATMLEMVGNLNEQQASYVKKIMVSIENMTRLVTNLLDIGRLEAGLDLQLEMVPIFDIVERVVGALQLQATQKQVDLSTDLPPDTVPLIEADQALLQQALQNLVENAVKYTNPGGQAVVKVYVHQNNMVFEIRDTGIGIAPVDQPRLFEKFYRVAQRDARKQQGSGLGLAIVKSIAERHGGKVWLESQLGKGSTFAIAIPLRQSTREKKQG